MFAFPPGVLLQQKLYKAKYNRMFSQKLTVTQFRINIEVNKTLQ